MPQRETADQVLKTIGKLSPQEQQVTIMRYYLDMKEKDIAYAQRVTLGTVKKQLFRARAKLYHDLQPWLDKEGD